MAYFKDLFRALLPLSLLILVGCDASPGVRRNHIELDPEVEAKVKEINLQRYGGTWLAQGSKGSLYLEINEDGYYRLEEDASRMPIRGDQGSLSHYKPGYMIIHSDREACKSRRIVILRLDRFDNAVRAVDLDEGQPLFQLAPVERQERTMLDDLACPE